MQVPSTHSFEFGPYAQLLKTLLPRARGIYLYACDGELLWSSDGVDSADLQPRIFELLESARWAQPGAGRGRRLMLDDAPAYSFLLRDELGVLLGVIGITCRAVPHGGEVPAFESVERTLAPLLELARRDLGAKRSLAESGRFNISDTQELQWLLDVSHVETAGGAGGDALKPLLEAFAARSDCDLVLLHVPERRLDRCSERSALAAGELETLRAVVAQHLLRVAQLQQRTLVINKVRDDGAGGLVPFRILCVPLARHGQVVGVVVAFNRASRTSFAAREARMLERLAPRLLEIIDARFDAVTGLMTRHAFDEHAALQLARDPRAARAIAYANVDRLHALNELFGFEAGDAALRAVADVWRGQPVPAESGLARLAGDRFVALLENTTLEAARAWAEATRLAVAALPERSTGLALSASFGVAEVAPGDTLERALAAAEDACRRARLKGGNRVQAFRLDDVELQQQQAELRRYRELVEAFEHGGFRLYVQPLSPMWDPSRPLRYEVLVRMLDTNQQPLAAGQFLAVAARHQLLARLDRWVLGELLARLAACGAAVRDQNAMFCVNLSGESLDQPDLAAQIGAALAAANVPPQLINFELNERAVVDRPGVAERFLGELRALGCSSSIDDFGTGASALRYLTALKVDALKIDGSFIRDFMTNPRSESVVRAILQIARQLELETVAESVESTEAAAHLGTLGVTYGQGNALAEPRPLGELLDGLARLSAPHAPGAAAHSGGEQRLH